MATQIWIDIGAGNGLLSDGTMSLHEPMLIHHQYGPVELLWEQHHKIWRYQSVQQEWKMHSYIRIPILQKPMSSCNWNWLYRPTPYTSFPFLIGPRNCIGQNFARVSMHHIYSCKKTNILIVGGVIDVPMLRFPHQIFNLQMPACPISRQRFEGVKIQIYQKLTERPPMESPCVYMGRSICLVSLESNRIFRGQFTTNIQF